MKTFIKIIVMTIFILGATVGCKLKKCDTCKKYPCSCKQEQIKE